eukprot:3472898-Rhodomonas_salina.1
MSCLACSLLVRLSSSGHAPASVNSDGAEDDDEQFARARLVQVFSATGNGTAGAMVSQFNIDSADESLEVSWNLGMVLCSGHVQCSAETLFGATRGVRCYAGCSVLCGVYR